MSIRTYAELVPPPEPEREVVLHMTREQAEYVAAVLARTRVGNPDAVFTALTNLGIRADCYSCDGPDIIFLKRRS